MRFPTAAAAKFGALLSLTVLLLGSAAPALAAAEPGVKDDGGFFKPDTEQKVNEDLKQIKQKYGKELVIETFAGVPDDRKQAWDAAKDDDRQRRDFFAKWLGDRAHALGVNGVYVLICKDPPHLEVKAGIKTKEKAFTQANQDKMRDILVSAFKEKRYDEGLTDAVKYFQEALKQNVGDRAPEPVSAGGETFGYPSAPSGSSESPPGNRPAVNVPPSNPPRSGFFHGSSCMWVIFVVIGAFILIRVLSGLGGGRRNYGGPGPGYGPGPGPGYGGGYGYGGGGGGGFFRGMFGGLLGGAAGSYLYDQFRHRGDQGTGPMTGGGGYVPPPTDTSSGGDFGSSQSAGDDQGQGFSGGGSGGDFGSSDSGGGGGDFGGSSGGDFGGGGDMGGGGGGGDSGGSGGDF